MTTIEEKITSLSIEEKDEQRKKQLESHMVTHEDVKYVEDLWQNDPRWDGVIRPYTAEEMYKLRGTLKIWHSFAYAGAERLWHLLNTEDYIIALGAMSGNQAVQQVEAGLKAIYLSGWQVAADSNSAAQTYPDQSLYPADSAPKLAQRINNALARCFTVFLCLPLLVLFFQAKVR